MAPLRLALARQPDLWNLYPYRTTFDDTPFDGMDDILLRYSRPEKHQGVRDSDAMINDTDLVLYDAWHRLPEAHPVVFNLMHMYRGITAGRVIVARLPPGGVIRPHADNYGAYATSKGMRFHVCVSALPGCRFHCGDETISPVSDEVWWFNHREVHSAENDSADDRIHLLVDVLME